MYCVHCGAQLDDAARFCSQCGAPVGSISFKEPPGGAESPLDGYYADPYADNGNYCRSYDYDPESRPINDFLLWNIFVTLFCCMPCGLAGIVFSFLCNGAKRRDDLPTARRYATIAQILFWISLVGGIGLVVVYTCFLALGLVPNAGAI